MDGLEGVSLLWPPGAMPGAVDPQPRLTAEQAADLELDSLVSALSLRASERAGVRDVLLRLCADPRVIGWRNGVLDSILGSPRTAERLEALLPKIDRLRQHHVPREKGELLHEVAWRLGELEIFLECVRELSDILASLEESTEGFRCMRESLARLRESEPVSRLMEELPGLLSKVRGIRSLTIGVNVDKDLQPSSATLLSINARSFDDQSPSFLGRLFGAGQGSMNGIAPLHRVPGEGANPMLQPLFRDLSDALTRSLRPVAASLQRFMGLRTQFLDRWGQELSFYLGAAKLTRRMRAAGLPLCRPGLAAAGVCRVEGCWNIVLALKLAEKGREAELSGLIVRNDVSFDPHEVTILTGPNQGGKTTFMRAVGLVHVMCQAGLHVPGTSALLGTIDAVHTHFPRNERGDLESGRFADEMRRLRDIFAQATPDSLILLNESLTATSARESLELAREVVSALQVLGARAIYTTHLYELAAEADAFNAGTPGPGRVTSLAAEPGPSFRIALGPPAGSSHAREVASRYGISFAQLVEVLRSRKILR